jgi:hypothetical protein
MRGVVMLGFGPDGQLRATRENLKKQLTFLEATYGPKHPEVRRMQAAIDVVDRQISDMDYERRKKAAGATTKPANVAPVTRPVGEDFHL